MSAVLDPRVIEQEIASIREREASPFTAGTKTNLFTLLIFRNDPGTDPGDPVEAALQYLLGRRPARIVTILGAQKGPTEALVTGRCSPDRRNRGVCFEEVRISAGEDGIGSDPGAWAPLVIRDLPVFAWLSAPPDRWLPTLAAASDLIDKIIVDSSRILPPARPGGDEMAAALRGIAAGGQIVSDFSWRRGTVLREQTARAFDPPEMRPQIPHLRRARLHGGSPAEAELYFRWLRSRLGRGLEAEHAWAGPLSEGFRIALGIEGALDIEIGCTKGGCLERGEEKGAYRFPSDGEILLDEVDTVTRDHVFQQAIAPREPSNG